MLHVYLTRARVVGRVVLEQAEPEPEHDYGRLKKLGLYWSR